MNGLGPCGSKIQQSRLKVLLKQVFIAQCMGIQQRQLDQEQFGFVGACLVYGLGQCVIDLLQSVDAECFCGVGHETVLLIGAVRIGAQFADAQRPGSTNGHIVGVAHLNSGLVIEEVRNRGLRSFDLGGQQGLLADCAVEEPIH